MPIWLTVPILQIAGRSATQPYFAVDRGIVDSAPAVFDKYGIHRQNPPP